jgi:hypothetical protein
MTGLEHLHKYLICSVSLELPSTATICVHDFWPSSSNVLPSEQLVHSRACEIHRIENNEVASAVEMAFETDNGDGMAGLLEIDRWKKGLVYVGAIADSSSSEVTLHGSEE